MTIELFGLENIPIVDSSSDISEIIKDAIDKQGCSIEHGDIILIAETLISKSEGTFINVDELVPSEKAIDLAEKSKKDPKLVEAILNESNEVVEFVQMQELTNPMLVMDWPLQCLLTQTNLLLKFVNFWKKNSVKKLL